MYVSIGAELLLNITLITVIADFTNDSRNQETVTPANESG